MCAMSGFKSPSYVGDFPITPIQFESCMDFCAQLCLKYSLNITPDTVMTHYEFDRKILKHPVLEKIDIIHLPPHTAGLKKRCWKFYTYKNSMVQKKKNERLKVVLWILIILILSGGINQASTKTELGKMRKQYTGRIQKMLRYITTEALSGKKETRYFWNYPNKNLLLV